MKLAFLSLTFIFAVVFSTASAAQPAPIANKASLKTEDFFRHPEFRDVKISPDGISLAATAPIRGRMALVAMELKTRKAIILTNFPDNDVVEFHWVNNNRLVFSLGNINEPSGSERRQGGGLFAIDRDGKDSRVLSPTVKETISRGNTVYRYMSYVGRTPALTDEIFATSNEINGFCAIKNRHFLSSSSSSSSPSSSPSASSNVL